MRLAILFNMNAPTGIGWGVLLCVVKNCKSSLITQYVIVDGRIKAELGNPVDAAFPWFLCDPGLVHMLHCGALLVGTFG